MQNNGPDCGRPAASRYREERSDVSIAPRGGALSQDFVNTLLLLIGGAVAVYLIIMGLVYVGNRRQSKRYRPGRPFEFEPVWFLSQPEEEARAGRAVGRELVRVPSAPTPTRRPQQTGGASDSW
jgi:hypothetical protein